MASRRQSLKALAEERGYYGACVWREVAPRWDAIAWDDWGDADVTVQAPTRLAATEGLRAALESMPLKRKGRT